MDQDLPTYQLILVMIIPLIFAVVIHEVAHGWVANRLGDPTARLMGRLTLNPIKHIDLIGTIIVPSLLAVLGGFIFGWAKPVPVNWKNLRSPRRDMALVAIAGPAMNLLMAIAWALLFGLLMQIGNREEYSTFLLAKMCIYGLMINVILFVLNLLPIPPLDGSRVVTSLLPQRAAATYNVLEPFGFFILLALIATGVLSIVMRPLINAVLGLIQAAFIS